jgi:hypothetical protein
LPVSFLSQIVAGNLAAPNEQICKLCQSSGLYLGGNKGKSHGFGPVHWFHDLAAGEVIGSG